MQLAETENHHTDTNQSVDLDVVWDESKLTVTLMDFVNGVIYSRQYTDDDIGGEINTEMNLADLFKSLSQITTNFETQIGQLKDDEFGQKAKNTLNYFCKIQKGGKIIVVYKPLGKINDNQKTYESILRLEKTRDMTEIEKIQKWTQTKKIQKSFPNETGQEQNKIFNLEEIQKKIGLKQELGTTQSEQSITQVKMSPQAQPSQDKFQEQMYASIEAQTLHSLPQPASGASFAKDELKVRLIKYDCSWWHYIFNKPINPNETATFKLKIVRSLSKNMSIGITDYARQKDSRSSCYQGTGNCICYYGDYGRKSPENIFQGDGFRQGDVLEVVVNRSSSTVSYIVNGTLQATHTNQILADPSRIFFPFVEMICQNDAVEWLIY